MLLKFAIFCIIYIIRIISKADVVPEKIVQISQSQLDDLTAKQDLLIQLQKQQELDLQAWKNDTTTLQNENKDLRKKVQDLKEDYEPQERKVWALMWFRWLSMIKHEIEWRETAVTNFTFNRQLFEEEKSKNRAWTEADEYRRQIWNQILENCTQNTHIISLVHEIEKTGIENAEFSRNIALGYRELANKLLAMMRWRNLPKFEKEPTFNTPITWSPEINKCLSTLMFDVDKYMAWDFKTNLAMDKATESPAPTSRK